jgi:DNA processing protein
LDHRPCLLQLARVSVSRDVFPTRALFASFGSAEGILRASPRDLEAVEGMRPATLRALVEARSLPATDEQLSCLEKNGIRPVSFEEAEYPENLKRIPDPPPVLFVKGDILDGDSRSLAVIGSRKASAYGTAVCERVVKDLVAAGLCVVSGMARGIDAVAHWACLENGGRTLAVLGTGLDVPYPKQNLGLFQKVPLQGALISEFLPGTLARPEHFPRRNRIISGLALGVLVVEASERSGTMITVRTALEQGREVFAVPGDIRSPQSRGTHRLIKQGAKLVAGVEDILEELGCPLWGEAPAPAAPAVASGRPAPALGSETPSYGRHGVALGNEECSTGEYGAARGNGVPWSEGHAVRRAARSGFGRPQAEDPPEAAAVMEILSDEGVLVDTLVQRTGWPLEKLNALLTELELLGRVKRLPGSRICRGGF